MIQEAVKIIIVKMHNLCIVPLLQSEDPLQQALSEGEKIMF